MKSKITEFSYGFAITHEIANDVKLSAAPYFPNLYEEGQAGGGYDVKFNSPASVLFLQFKCSEMMKTKGSREYKLIKSEIDSGIPLQQITVPYRRFFIMNVSESNQHELLLDLEANHHGCVFYAAPDFFEREEIDYYFSASNVGRKSKYFRPSDIGSIWDGDHSVVWTDHVAYRCSSPKAVPSLGYEQVLKSMVDRAVESETSLIELVNDISAQVRQLSDKRRVIRPEVKDFIADMEFYKIPVSDASPLKLSELLSDDLPSFRYENLEDAEFPQIKEGDNAETVRNKIRTVSKLANIILGVQPLFVQPKLKKV